MNTLTIKRTQAAIWPYKENAKTNFKIRFFLILDSNI